MEIGVGLPSGVPGCEPDLLLDWARRADELGFASLATVDRLLYGNWDPLVALSAAAAVTRRIRLVTCILISPLRETATLAKQVLGLDALSRGRVSLGLATGARRDDYEASETPYAGRGDRLGDQLVALRDHWESGEMGPAPTQPDGPPILLGGSGGAALGRMARHADGYIHGGGPARGFVRAATQAGAAWEDAGRPGHPRLWAMAYYALGDAVDTGREYMLDYYAFTGAFAPRIAEELVTTPLALRELCDSYADAGCEQLLLFPAVASPDQLERLADAR
ncbi:LLM class flavin-dependent oxidoreductase [soil metagenome]|jgi:alkanesulfonate monooxygenase SsuD/methylene tetrahydromethanopterin reductase-like flavin-dependent oxidoreductase (luciferase family)